jgi:hypothetical protein
MKLYQDAKKKGIDVSTIPMPPVGTGWDLFNDFEKEELWHRTIDWAKYNNLYEVLPVMTDEEYYKA